MSLRSWAFALKRDVHAVWLSARDPRTPWYAKAFAIGVAAYALSPIDLIPDFIPILGYLDDLLLVPLGLWLAIRMIPPQVLADHRQAAAAAAQKPISRVGAAVIIAVWIALALMAALWIGRRMLRAA